MSEKKWENYIVKFVQIFFMVTFCSAIVYLVYYFIINTRTTFEEHIDYLDVWNVSIEGSDMIPCNLPCKLDVDKGVPVTYETVLPGDLQDDYWIATRNSKDITVYVDGEEIFKWTKGDAIVPGELSRAVFIYIPLKSSYSGKKITAIKSNPGLYNGSLGRVMIGDKYSLRLEILRTRGGIQFAVAFFIFVLSVILTVIGVFLKGHYNQKVYLVSSSFGIMVASAWMLFDSDVFEVILGFKYVNGFLSYIMTFIMIYPFVFYIDGLQEGRYRKVYAVLAIIETVNFVTFLTLHLTGVWALVDSLPIIDGIIAAIAIIVMTYVIVDIVKGRAFDYIYVASGFLVFIVLSILEIIFITGADRTEGNFILIGLFVLMVVSIVQQIEDIKREQGYKQVEYEATVARTEFLVNMSHEIRTPINTILGMNEMIMQDDVSPRVRDYSEKIQHSGQILMSLINDILDYSRYQMEDEIFVKRDYNVRRMLDVLVAVLKDGAELKKLDANVVIPADIPKYLKGDEQHISRVLSNIISNAIKYTNKGSISLTVVYETTDKGGFLNFYIKDTGVGIKPEHLKTIFEPFARADIKNNRSVAGTGLGLAITKDLVEKMGGTIEVMSIYGEGSSFRIRIPQEVSDYVEEENDDAAVAMGDEDSHTGLVDSETVALSEVSEQSDVVKCNDELENHSSRYKAPKAKILAVDDNYSNIIVISEFLKCIEAQIDTASGGAEAIQMAKLKKYDIILMDHMMPEPDGVETMHIIRDSLESLNRKTPDIVLTANAIGNCKEQYITEGFDDYLSKPIDREHLLKTIKKYLNPKIVIELEGCDDAGESVADTVSISDNLKSTLSRAKDNSIIDFTALFARFENQEKVVNMILKETVREGGKKMALLKQCFEDGDIGRYAVESHGVKGVMASICANKFSAHAKEHEFAAKDGNADFIKDDLEKFLDEYRTVLDFVTKYLKDAGVEVNNPGVKIGGDTDGDIDAILYDIEDSLNDFDADKALSYIEQLEGVVTEEQMDLVNKLKRYTDDFEYDKALECCASIRGN